MMVRMGISVSIGYASIRLCAGGTSQYSETLSRCGAKIGAEIGKKFHITARMHPRKAILSYGASRGAVDLGILPLRTRIATKRTYATRIRTAENETPRGQVSTLSRTASETITAWLVGSGGLGRLRH